MVVPRPLHPRIPLRIPADPGKPRRPPITVLEAVLLVGRADHAVVQLRRRAVLLQFQPAGDVPLLPEAVLIGQPEFLGVLAGGEPVQVAGLQPVGEPRLLHVAAAAGRRARRRDPDSACRGPAGPAACGRRRSGSGRRRRLALADAGPVVAFGEILVLVLVDVRLLRRSLSASGFLRSPCRRPASSAGPWLRRNRRADVLRRRRGVRRMFEAAVGVVRLSGVAALGALLRRRLGLSRRWRSLDGEARVGQELPRRVADRCLDAALPSVRGIPRVPGVPGRRGGPDNPPQHGPNTKTNKRQLPQTGRFAGSHGRLLLCTIIVPVAPRN